MEIVAALAVVSIVMGALVGSLSLLLAQGPKESAKLTVENRHQTARYWLERDANSAENFVAGITQADCQGPCSSYGTFTWRDFSGETTNTYAVDYFYSSTLKALMREERKNNVVQSNEQIAADILQASDVVFTWTPAQRKITVTIKPTIQESLAVGDISRTATLVAWLRYEAEGIVSIPALTPIPTPIPGSVTYFVSANPVVLAGTYVSGNAASLNTVDTNFYVVDSSVGSPKEVIWTVFSQTITDPPTIANIDIRWSGKDNKENTAMEIFIKTSAGASYSATPDVSFTSVVPDVETTFQFYVSEAKVAEINTSKVVFMKVRGVAQANNRLSANQLIFIASPEGGMSC